MIDRKVLYVAYLLNQFIFKCNYSLKWFLINIERRKKIKVISSGPMLAMSVLRYV